MKLLKNEVPSIEKLTLLFMFCVQNCIFKVSGQPGKKANTVF